MWNDDANEFNNLAAVWQSEASRQRDASPPTAAAIIARARMLDTKVRQRDRVETIVSLLLLPVFAVLAVIVPNPLSKVGAALICLGCVITPIRLRLARQRSQDRARPLAANLRAELDWVRAQTQLLRSVVFWYLAPLGLGVILFIAGGKGTVMMKGIVALVVVVFYAWLAVLNWRAATQHLVPYRTELETWLSALEGNGKREAGSGNG